MKLLVAALLAVSCADHAPTIAEAAPARPTNPIAATPSPTTALKPAAIQAIEIRYNYGGWQTHRRVDTLVRGAHGFTVGSTTIPFDLVDRLAGSLDELVPSDGLKSCFSHTDDYPRFAIVLQTAKGDVQLSSTSNCGAFAPWNVVANGTLYFQASGAIGRALQPILRLVDAKVFGPRARNIVAPFTLTTSSGRPPANVQLAAPAADRYQAILASSPQLRRRFTSITVLEVRCDPRISSTCEQVDVSAKGELAADVTLAFRATVDGGALRSVDPAIDLGALELANSKLGKAMRSFGPLAMQASNDCTMANRLVARVRSSATLTGDACTHYFVTSPQAPELFFVPAAQLGWFRLPARGTADFYRALGFDKAKIDAAEKATPAAWWHVSVDGKLTSIPR